MKTPPPPQQKQEVRRQEQHACASRQAVEPGSAPEPRPATGLQATGALLKGPEAARPC